MSARSPRGSLSGASNVAEDFAESLRDLQQNNKYEISNLTLIAKESTEHAQAISSTLETHIRTTAPSRKLPALYVLDSIVKNVGTPYTVYLGRGLYSTFMEAYTLVDGMTRRSMEGMLKTWKEPVPGSTDPSPVFPVETVRPIENALLKAKTAALQNQRQTLPQNLYRNTPTPPQFNGQFATPPQQAQAQHFHGYGNQQPTPQQQHIAYQPPPTLSNPQTFAPTPLAQQISSEIEGIKHDLASLISRMQGQFAVNPQDQGLRTKLQALLQLQEVLKTQAGRLGPGDVQQIKFQVSQLSAAAPPAPNPVTQQAVPVPHWQPSALATTPAAQLYYPPQPPAPFVQVPTPTPQGPASMLTPDALHGLQALLANGQKPSTPQIRNAAPILQDASHAQLSNVQNKVAAAPAMSSTDLIAALTQNNLLPQLPPSSSLPPMPPSVPAHPPPAPSTAALLQSLKGILPPPSQSSTSTPLPATLTNGKPDIPMTSASLKVFRPELVRALYDAQPNQCNNCGRRFLATPDGRAKKEKHLDWHFRTNQRMASDASHARHRVWFPDEMPWIQQPDFDASTTSAADQANAANAAATRKPAGARDRTVRAPPGLTKSTCSVCFEDLQSSYAEELQDWVFRDAVRLGHPPAILHASCADEIRKSSATTAAAAAGAASSPSHAPAVVPVVGPSLAAALAAAAAATGKRSRSATPDSTLGKRKADAVMAGAAAGGTRVKIE